jgi:hypothetical protein
VTAGTTAPRDEKPADTRARRRAFQESPGEPGLRNFVLTGQSNSLGTLAAPDMTMRRDAPGTHPNPARLFVHIGAIL